MNHEDNDDLFQRLEADMAADFGGEVVDLDKARAARGESGDSRPVESADTSGTGSADPDGRESGTGDADASGDAVVMVDGPAPSGPGLMERVRGAERRPVRLYVSGRLPAE